MDFHYSQISKKNFIHEDNVEDSVVLPVWVPPPEVRPADGLLARPRYPL